MVGVVAHGVEDLGGDDDAVARDLGEGAAGDLFAGAERVHVGGVEEIDASVEGTAEEGLAGLFVEDPFAPLGRAIGHAAEAKASS